MQTVPSFLSLLAGRVDLGLYQVVGVHQIRDIVLRWARSRVFLLGEQNSREWECNQGDDRETAKH